MTEGYSRLEMGQPRQCHRLPVPTDHDLPSRGGGEEGAADCYAFG